MPDSVASNYMCENDSNGEILVDKGYPASNPKFIVPPGDGDPLKECHQNGRAIVEHYFSRLSILWKMCGSCYRRKVQLAN